ncbi:MAG: hypothetical protein ACXVB4_02920 [Pseudobdellovibrionaceae bacterium]
MSIKLKVAGFLFLATAICANFSFAMTDWAVKCTATKFGIKTPGRFTLTLSKKIPGNYSDARQIETSGSIYNEIEGLKGTNFNPADFGYASVDSDRYLTGGLVIDFSFDIHAGGVRNPMWFLRAQESVNNYSLHYSEFGKATVVLLDKIVCEYP